MGQFLSCDWGTSSFRLRLVEAETLNILAEQKTDQGIASVFALWQQSAEVDKTAKASFYLNRVLGNIHRLESQLALPLQGLPVIFSGMASSSIGLLELPYGQLPFSTDGKGVFTSSLEPTANFPHPVLIISGIQSEDDVMRGEETQLIGVVSGLENRGEDKVFVFPGTHSKHIWVKGGRVVSFKTYMTGEFFDLLSNKSILSSSVSENRTIQNWEAFNQGITKARTSNLLNASFLVRTNALFEIFNKEENHDFLSGLLIGTELKELLHEEGICLCCSSHLKSRYEQAFQQLEIRGVQLFSGEDIDKAVIRGQIQIYNETQNL